MPRNRFILSALGVPVLLAVAGLAQTVPAVPPAAAAPVAAAPAVKLTPAEIVAERAKYLKEVRAAIAGHAKDPAETVFKNIRTLKGLPAGRLLAIMDLGYSRSLGVSCTHCHTPGEWEKDDKPQKQIAREMSRLAATINNELLPKIAHLDSATPVVNCTTCHRGEVKPALDLAARP